MRSALRNRSRLWLLASSLAVLSVPSASPSVAASGGMMPDFALEDVNATSSTFGQLVSPRDYLRQVSGWYFGTAT